VRCNKPAFLFLPLILKFHFKKIAQLLMNELIGAEKYSLLQEKFYPQMIQVFLLNTFLKK